jgi:ribosomal protein S14
MNSLLEKKISIRFVKHQCLQCGSDRPIFRQGFCRSCFFEIPQAGDWIMHPEKSTAHLDLADRDLEFEKKMQLQPHIVYLANSSNIKVGVTRKSQVPTRWIDQGAHEAIEIAETPNRYLAGITELALKAYVSDKTNWRRMLTGKIEDVDLLEWKEKLTPYIPEEAQPYILNSSKEIHMDFPVLQYPEKVKSLNLDKQPEYSGTLLGIKGQYLIFSDHTVMNVRGNEGYVISLQIH